jgi:hypothetical protein
VTDDLILVQSAVCALLVGGSTCPAEFTSSMCRETSAADEFPFLAFFVICPLVVSWSYRIFFINVLISWVDQ